MKPSVEKIEMPEMQGPVKAADFREYYANHLRLGLTPVDVALTLGRLVEPSPGIARAEEQFTVRLSPQFFKALVTNLTGLLAAYEGQFGTIPLSNKTPQEAFAGMRAAVEEIKKKATPKAKR
jgi:hypothetical protein